MRRKMFGGKIHRAVITQADLDYEGSLTVDADLLDAAGILEYEAVHVWNITRGSRLVTYALHGNRGSGVICANGAAAHDNKPGDLVIIASFVDLAEEEIFNYAPRVVRVDENNHIVGDTPEIPGPNPPLPIHATS